MLIIAGKYRGRRLFAPKGDKTRPTASKLRGSLFNILQGEIEGTEFLDLFSGSGAIGLEALSRGAKKITFIDSSLDAINALKKNVHTLDVEKECMLLFGDFARQLMSLSKKKAQFDIIFADPPYDLKGVQERLVQCIDEGNLLKKGGVLFVENSVETPIFSKKLECVQTRKSGKTFLHEYRGEACGEP